MRAVAQPKNETFANAIIITVGVIGILYVGQEIIVPVLLSGVLTVILLPLVNLLLRHNVPKALAIFVAVGLALGVVMVTGSLIGRTAVGLISDLPKYEQQLRDKAESFKSATSSNSAYDNAAKVIKRLQNDISPEPAQDTNGQPAQTVVTTNQSDTSFVWAQSILSTVAHPFLQVATVFVLLTFMLFYQQELRDRMILLGGSYDVRRSTLALNESAKRLSHLMLGVLSINVLVGLVIGVVLWLLGIPGALMWGVLTALLRFIPFIGTFIASVFPVLTALAVGDGWSLAIAVLATVIVTEFSAAQFVEPIILGRLSGLWPPALIAAALFWVSLWGPIGLVLSTPLTIFLLVFSQHIRSWRPLAALLGEAPVLAPEDAFYGRLIVGDAAATASIANTAIGDGDVEGFINNVVVPALHRISRDVEFREMPRAQLEELKDTLEEVLEIVAPLEESEDAKFRPALVISSHGVINHCAALAFAALLRSKSIPNTVMRFGEAARVAREQKRLGVQPPVVVVSLHSLEERLTLHLSKKLKSKYGSILTTSWIADPKTPQAHMPSAVAEGLSEKLQPRAKRSARPVAQVKTVVQPV